jgi:hypothetical protein
MFGQLIILIVGGYGTLWCRREAADLLRQLPQIF